MKKCGIKSILIDTNILIDFTNNRRKNSKIAKQIFTYFTDLKIQVMIAYHSLFDYQYYARKDLKVSKANFTNKQIEAIIVRVLDNALDYLTVVGADHFDMKLGIKSFARHQDFEDNLVIAAAERAKADYVLTSDNEMLKDYPEIAISYEDLLMKIK